MKLNLKIIFLLAVLTLTAFKVITSMNTAESNKGVVHSVEENNSGSMYGNTGETGYAEIPKMTPSNFLLKNNSCSILY